LYTYPKKSSKSRKRSTKREREERSDLNLYQEEKNIAKFVEGKKTYNSSFEKKGT